MWSVIAKRMKHGHRSWSRRGGNHLAKILAKKCSGKLYEVTERLRSPVFEEEKVEELYGEILMSAKAPKKEEKGYEYPVMGHVVGLDGKIQGERKRLLHKAGYYKLVYKQYYFNKKKNQKESCQRLLDSNIHNSKEKNILKYMTI